jgi:hypothetical protein
MCFYCEWEFTSQGFALQHMMASSDKMMLSAFRSCHVCSLDQWCGADCHLLRLLLLLFLELAEQ